MAVGQFVESLRHSIAPLTDEWFPDRPQDDIEIRVLADRPSCLLLTVHLDRTSPPVALAKMRRDLPRRTTAAGRPRLRQEPTTPEQLTFLEWTGLKEIERACGGVTGLGAVRPLLLLEGEATLVMSYVDAPPLRSLLLDLSRLRPGRGDLEAALSGCRLAGQWLRAFQESTPAGDRPVRQGTAEEVVDRLRACGSFLGSKAWRGLATTGAELTTSLTPGRLRVVVGHGDFAPRNMLLRDGRLTVIDPMPRWQVPAYDDVCRLLVGARLLGAQVHTHGLALDPGTLNQLEEAVLAAYLDPDEPRAPLRAHQLLILMDKWTSMVGNSRHDALGRLARRSAALADHYVRAEAERLLDLARAGA